jgi:hypothetical protein
MSKEQLVTRLSARVAVDASRSAQGIFKTTGQAHQSGGTSMQNFTTHPGHLGIEMRAKCRVKANMISA